MERLNILYNSDNLLGSKYCSEEFRTSLAAFFEEQKKGGLIEQGRLQKQLVLLTKSAEELDSIDYSLKFLKEYEIC